MGVSTEIPITQKYLRGTFERSIHSEMSENTSMANTIATKMIVSRAAR